MKTIVLLMTACCFCLNTLGQQTYQNQVPVREAQTLTMHLHSGASVHIRTWDEPAVAVHGQVFKCQGGECDLSLRGTPAGAELRSAIRTGGRPATTSTSIHLEVTVPKNFNIQLTSAGGEVSATGLHGRLQGSTGGGALTLSQMQGEVRFNSGGGTIRISQCLLEASINTGGGEIIIADSDIDGGFNTGGGNASLQNVRIYGGVRTGRGDVTAAGLRGGFSASTGKGDIFVSIERTGPLEALDMDLSTGTGNVELVLPPNLQPAIDVQLAYTINKEGFLIVSDFPLDLRHTDDWDYSQGSPRKYIRGESAGQSDGQHIRIRNVNGDVKIRKD